MLKTQLDELTKNVESQMVSLNDTFEMFFSNINNTLERFISNELLANYQPDSKTGFIRLSWGNERNKSFYSKYIHSY